MTTAQRRLLSYARARQGSATYTFATTDWRNASPYILASGTHVLPLGGFSGRAPFPTLPGFQHLVRAGQLRYVLVAPARAFGRPAAPTTTTRTTGWVTSSCSSVAGVPTLYDCSEVR